MTAQSIDSASLTTTDLTTQTLDVGQVFSAPGATFDDATIGALQATTIDTDVMSAQGGRLGSVTSDSTQTTVDRLIAAEISVDGTLSVSGTMQATALTAAGPTSLRDTLSVSRDATFLQGVCISGALDSASVQTGDLQAGGLSASQDATFLQGVTVTNELQSGSVQTGLIQAGDVHGSDVTATGTVQADTLTADRWLIIPEGFRCLNAPDGSLLRNGTAIGLCISEQWVPLYGDATPEFIDTPQGKQWDAGPDTSCRGYQETGLAHGRVAWPSAGQFVVDPDASGPIAPSTAYCDVFRGWQLMLVYRTAFPDYELSPLPATRPTTLEDTAPGSHEYPAEAGYPPGTVEEVKLQCWAASFTGAPTVSGELTDPAEVQPFAEGIGANGAPDFLLSGTDLLPNNPHDFRMNRWSSSCRPGPSQGAEFHVWWR